VAYLLCPNQLLWHWQFVLLDLVTVLVAAVSFHLADQGVQAVLYVANLLLGLGLQARQGARRSLEVGACWDGNVFEKPVNACLEYDVKSEWMASSSRQ
jgi:hypothetical protein